MSLSPLVSFQSRFVTYLLKFPRTYLGNGKVITLYIFSPLTFDITSIRLEEYLSISLTHKLTLYTNIKKD
jgi:hypothetical protein